MGRKALDESQKADSLKRQYARQNDYLKNKYDRINIAIEKGYKEKIKENRIKTGDYKSINDYINNLIKNDIDN